MPYVRVQSRKGFILLTGEVGTGKTTLINKLLELLHKQEVPTAFVFNSRLDVPTFLNYMMQDFGIPCDAKSKSRVLILFYNWLLDRYRAGETAVLIVDEAQNLSEELLEEIRMMTNVESSTEKLLQIVLVGQPELEQKLKQPQLRQLRQRITLRARTFPLSLGETKLYVNQRLRIAGSNGQQLFDPASLEAIYRYSNGIPRVVNLICEQCLVSAFVDKQKVVMKAWWMRWRVTVTSRRTPVCRSGFSRLLLLQQIKPRLLRLPPEHQIRLEGGDEDVERSRRTLAQFRTGPSKKKIMN